MSVQDRYGQWDQDLERAISAHRNGDAGINRIARMYGVPELTILRHENDQNAIVNSVKHFGRPTILPENVEKQIVGQILDMEERLFGLTIIEARKLAYDQAKDLNIPHNFN